MSLSTDGRELSGELVYIPAGGDAKTQDYWSTGVRVGDTDTSSYFAQSASGIRQIVGSASGS